MRGWKLCRVSSAKRYALSFNSKIEWGMTKLRILESDLLSAS
jgi:hypothetical protein